jgi:hypothetical protein
MELESIDCENLGVFKAGEGGGYAEQSVTWNGRLVDRNNMEDLTAMVNFRIELQKSDSRNEVVKNFYLSRSVELENSACRALSEAEDEEGEEESDGGGYVRIEGGVNTSGEQKASVSVGGYKGGFSGGIDAGASRDSSGRVEGSVQGHMEYRW